MFFRINPPEHDNVFADNCCNANNHCIQRNKNPKGIENP